MRVRIEVCTRLNERPDSLRNRSSQFSALAAGSNPTGQRAPIITAITASAQLMRTHNFGAAALGRALRLQALERHRGVVREGHGRGDGAVARALRDQRSEEHTSELQ